MDATVIEARPRPTQDEKQAVREGKVPSHWCKARASQADGEGRWTIKRGRKLSPHPGETQARNPTPIAIPVFDYKNHIGIGRTHGLIRRFAVTHAIAASLVRC